MRDEDLKHFISSVPDKRILLHSCCAPCAGGIVTRLKEHGIICTLFFYNPNIYPRDEYLLRKDEEIKFAKQEGTPFVDGDYDNDLWAERIKGYEDQPERGTRCSICFDIRMEKTAQFAQENSFSVFATTLGLSRWKDLNQVNDAGLRAAARYDDLKFLNINWRKNGGSQEMYTVAKNKGFYKQEYCGCAYSLRDTNKWRAKNGKPKIIPKSQFYGPNV